MFRNQKRWLKLVSALLAAAFVFAFPAGIYGGQQAPENISAKGYILMEASSGKVLAGKEEHEKRPMASTTKIMTALLTLEQDGLDDYFKVDNDAIMVEGTSMGLVKDDQVSLRSLAYGMLLSSGNDAANLAAVKISGSIEKFAEKMNAKAVQIGMKDTHFVTPSGLHDEEHYSTPYDMALLAREALKNEDFAEICGQKKAKLTYGNPPYTRWLSNHNKLLDYYEGCIGMKTGFTKKAGRCLVSAAERDGVTLICVTLNASNDWQDHTKLFDYGFSVAERQKVEVDLSQTTFPVVGGVKDELRVNLSGELYAVLSQKELESASQRILRDPFCYAPIKEGDTVGKLQLIYEGNVVAEETLVAAENIEQKQVDLTAQKSIWSRVKSFFHKLFRR